MKIIDFYKFIRNNDIEYHWYDYKKKDVMFFVPCYLMKEFNDLLPASIFDDEGLSCVMKDGYLCFDASSIFDYFDWDLKDVFEDVFEQVL